MKMPGFTAEMALLGRPAPHRVGRVVDSKGAAASDRIYPQNDYCCTCYGDGYKQTVGGPWTLRDPAWLDCGRVCAFHGGPDSMVNGACPSSGNGGNPPPCKNEGEAASDQSECCPNRGLILDGGVCRLCKGDGQAASYQSQCCSGLTLRSENCSTGEPQCGWHLAGLFPVWSCEETTLCNLVCRSCKGSGQSFSSVSECCSGRAAETCTTTPSCPSWWPPWAPTWLCPTSESCRTLPVCA